MPLKLFRKVCCAEAILPAFIRHLRSPGNGSPAATATDGKSKALGIATNRMWPRSLP